MAGRLTAPATPSCPPHTFDYELFNHNKFSVRSWSWNYRGCWHQTCPPVVLVERFEVHSMRFAARERAAIPISRL